MDDLGGKTPLFSETSRHQQQVLQGPPSLHLWPLSLTRTPPPPWALSQGSHGEKKNRRSCNGNHGRCDWKFWDSMSCEKGWYVSMFLHFFQIDKNRSIEMLQIIKRCMDHVGFICVKMDHCNCNDFNVEFRLKSCFFHLLEFKGIDSKSYSPTSSFKAYWKNMPKQGILKQCFISYIFFWSNHPISLGFFPHRRLTKPPGGSHPVGLSS